CRAGTDHSLLLAPDQVRRRGVLENLWRRIHPPPQAGRDQVQGSSEGLRMSYAAEARQSRVLSSAQRAHDELLPEDDLEFLDTAEGEDFAREEEEELQRTGAGRVIG